MLYRFGKRCQNSTAKQRKVYSVASYCYFYRRTNYRINITEVIIMDKQMFCFQCEQTAGCTGCTGSAGVCGKKSDTAVLQDKLTGALIGLARASQGNDPTADMYRTILSGLFTTITNVNFDNESILEEIERVHKAK